MTDSRFKPYSEIKDSGIEWLGQIPAHWGVQRLKTTVASSQNGVWGDEVQGDADDIVCIRVADFDRQRMLVCEPQDGFTVRSVSGSQRKGRVLKQNDLLLEKSGGGEKQLVGAVVRYQFPEPAVCSNFVARVVPSDGHEARFLACLHYSLYSARVNLRSIKQNTGIQNLDEKQYLSEAIALPNLSEQLAIADFLDRETAKIDALVQKKERLIELLQEKRTALITHAVTKGLDPNVPMKDSGIEWLGQIPAHWKELELKFALAEPITDGPHETPEFLDEGIPFLSAESVKEDRLDFKKKRGFISEEDHLRFSRKYSPRRGDVYMVKSGATTGNVARVETDEVFDIWSPLAAMRPDLSRVTTEFLFFFLKSKICRKGVELSWSFGTQQNIGMGVLSNLRLVLPPLGEQEAITEYLNRETSKLDALIAKVGEAIERLKEYRTALISAAVTGKIDVRREAGFDCA